MCGIVGFSGPPNSTKINAALNSISHRGPDGLSSYEDEYISLGHVRLSIIDIKMGDQPMHSEDGRYVIIFNGEIYNYQVLKKKLIENGRILKTNSDTEVLLYWMIDYGVNGLLDLNGMFSFALWDRLKRRLILARDRLGMKPLYYTRHQNHIYFASEIKALLNLGIKAKADFSTIFEFVTFQNIYSNSTFFEGISKLPAASYMAFDPEDGIIIKEYWNYSSSDAGYSLSHNEIIEKYSLILNKSINRHMISDVPVGVFLSGGIDSSLVASHAASFTSGPINTFTGAFKEGPYYDERGASRVIASSIGAISNEIVISQSDFASEIGRVIYHLDEPTLGTGALPQFLVSKMASQHVKVSLTGHGGDETFAGYQVNRVFAFKDSLFNKNTISALKLLKMPISELSRFLYFLLYPIVNPEVGHGAYIMHPKKLRISILTNEFLCSVGSYEPLDELTNIVKAEKTVGEALTRLYLKTYLPTLFMQEDKVSMAHSLESRMPLCDNELLDFSLSLSLTQKMNNGELKSIPRSVAKLLLPDMILRQPKRGFPTPYHLWFKTGKTKEIIEDLLLSPRTRSRNIFKYEYLQNLIKKNRESNTSNLFDYERASKIYSIAIIELWYRTFIDQELPMVVV